MSTWSTTSPNGRAQREKPARWVRLHCPGCKKRLGDVALDRSRRVWLIDLALYAARPCSVAVDEETQVTIERDTLGRASPGRRGVRSVSTYLSVPPTPPTVTAAPVRGPRAQGDFLRQRGNPAQQGQHARYHPKGGVYWPDDPAPHEVFDVAPQPWTFACIRCRARPSISEASLSKLVSVALASGDHHVELP